MAVTPQMSDNEKLPEVEFSSLIGNLETMALPEDWTAVGGIALIRCDAEGGPVWAFRYFGADLTDEDVLGALIVQTELVKSRAIESYIDG